MTREPLPEAKSLWKRWNKYWHKRHQSSVECAMFYGWDTDPSWQWAYVNPLGKMVKHARRLGIPIELRRFEITEEGLTWTIMTVEPGPHPDGRALVSETENHS